MKQNSLNAGRAKRGLWTISLVIAIAAVTGILFLSDLKAESDQGTGAAAATETDVAGTDRGLIMPMLNPTRGRKLFANKGCVVCHSVNGVGGEDAAALDASTMEPFMNPFEFTARMWRGAEAMIVLQRDELGEQIEFTGTELADIIAFAHDLEEQQQFSEDDIPPQIRQLIAHGDDGDDGEAGEAHDDEADDEKRRTDDK